MAAASAAAVAVWVAFLAAGAPAPARDARDFEAAYARGDWPAAAVAAEQWAENEPDNPAAAYNAACAFALAGRTQVALGWLRRAGETGFAGVRSIEEDPDLASLRGDAGFGQATAGIRANRERLFAEFRAAAAEAEILTIPPPAAATGPRPLIIVLHGYGGEPAGQAELYREVAAEHGAVLAAPSGLRPGPSGRGFSWTYRDEAEWWVLQAIERISAQYEIDAGRIVLAGFSQGATVALMVGLKHPERFAGVLAVAGQYEAHLMPVPADAAPRVYLLVGREDPFARTYRQAAMDFRSGGVEVHRREIAKLGHAFPPRATAELRRGLAFLFAE